MTLDIIADMMNLKNLHFSGCAGPSDESPLIGAATAEY
jgi:hypothetical protein